MRCGQRGIRAVLAFVAAGSAAVLTPVAPAAAAPVQGDVQIRVDDISPSAPVRTTKPSPLQFQLTLTNTSGEALKDVRVLAYRGDPIGNQGALDASLADRTPPTDGLAVGPTKAVRVDLDDTPVRTTFATTTSIADEGRLCLCVNAVYPIYLVARADDGAGPVVGSTATYVPSVVDDVAPTKVSWLWPLIDRPHRLSDETVFTDDDLTGSVSSGGRLDRALQTVEDLDDVPITLVVDPELLDELEVMATGRYRVEAESGTTAGTGKDAARAWLDRFGALLTDDSAVQVSLTPYADPDTVSLGAQGLPWETTLPTAMTRRVTAALDGRAAATDVAWPAGGVMNRPTLDSLAASGVTTVVLKASAVSPSTEDGTPVTVTRLASDSGPITGAMTSSAMQTQVAAAVADDSGATAALPILTAEIAVRAINGGSQTTHAVLTPPRYVDPSPLRASRAITDTSTSPFSTATAVRDLAADRPTGTSRLRTPSADAPHLPVGLVRRAGEAAAELPDVNALLRSSPDARTLLAGLPRAIQRTTSSAWRNDATNPFTSRQGFELAGTLADQIEAIMSGVRIVSKQNSSYTLGSDNSALPVTVENTLPYTVEIQVSITARDNLPGFSTPGTVRTRRISANAKLTVQVPSRLERSGRIPVLAQLRTSNGQPLGESVELYVRSTVFGVIGIVITVGAGSVLALALIVRFGRRLQRLRRKAAKAQQAGPPTESALAPAGEPAP